MNKCFLLIVFLILSVIFSCKKNNTDPTKSYSVSGKIISDSKPIENATVSLNDKINFTTQSNSEGDFIINDVPEGEYTLNIEKTQPDGSYIKKSSDISVLNNINFESLLLPKGVKLSNPFDVTSTTMHLSWSPTDANDFREYKLYSHTTSGLDENTGTLVHVATAINDTQFTVTNLNPLTDYFFRVYIMNEFGKLGVRKDRQQNKRGLQLYHCDY